MADTMKDLKKALLVRHGEVSKVLNDRLENTAKVLNSDAPDVNDLMDALRTLDQMSAILSTDSAESWTPAG